MAVRPRPASRRTTSAAGLAGVVAGLVLLAIGSPGTAAAVPPLPASEYTHFLSNLSVPVTAPGSTVVLSGTLTNALSVNVSSVSLTFEFYAFNAFPGNATGPLPASGAPAFATGSGSASTTSLTFAGLTPNETVPVSASVEVPSGAADGDYVVRAGLEFGVNGTAYLLESRGYFSYATWTNATATGGGNSTINLTRLGVSGILPETALLVRSNPYPWVLYGLLAGAVILAAVGGFYAVRRGPGSRSGARGPPEPASAPSAFGKRRSKDGD